MRLKNKVAVITGAGSGIGRVSAILFAKEGAKVVVVDNNSKKGEETRDKIIKNNGKAFFVQADISSATDVEKTFDIVVKKYGAIHILYNNAGIFSDFDGMVTKITEETWNRILDINLKGTFLCCKYGIPKIIESKGGAVINTSSSAGVIGVPGCDAYTSSKGAIISLTRSMAIEYAPSKVRVNCVVPCAIATEMNRKSARENPNFNEGKFLAIAPTRRYGTCEDVAYMSLYLASDESSYVIGTTFVIDGGITIMNKSY